jgi:hypothetical protein
MATLGELTQGVLETFTTNFPYLTPDKKHLVAGQRGHGCTEDVVVGGVRVMRAYDPVLTYCCGIACEVLFKVAAAAGIALTVAQAKEIIAWAFLDGVLDKQAHFPGPHPERITGIAGGLVHLGLGDWVCTWEDGQPVGTPLDSELGDAGQVQWAGETAPERGHSVIICETGVVAGSECTWDFSANIPVPKVPTPFEWGHGLPRRSGVQYDYRKIAKPGRRFHIARLRV